MASKEFPKLTHVDELPADEHAPLKKPETNGFYERVVWGNISPLSVSGKSSSEHYVDSNLVPRHGKGKYTRLSFVDYGFWVEYPQVNFPDMDPCIARDFDELVDIWPSIRGAVGILAEASTSDELVTAAQELGFLCLMENLLWLYEGGEDTSPEESVRGYEIFMDLRLESKESKESKESEGSAGIVLRQLFSESGDVRPRTLSISLYRNKIHSCSFNIVHYWGS